MPLLHVVIGDLAGIHAPALIVNGADDPLARLGNRLMSSLANATWVTLPGVDHFGLPAQAEFIRQAVEFLGHGAPGRGVSQARQRPATRA